MNDDKELKSLLAFWTRHNITSSRMIHDIPDQKIAEYLGKNAEKRDRKGQENDSQRRAKAEQGTGTA